MVGFGPSEARAQKATFVFFAGEPEGKPDWQVLCMPFLTRYPQLIK